MNRLLFSNVMILAAVLALSARSSPAQTVQQCRDACALDYGACVRPCIDEAGPTKQGCIHQCQLEKNECLSKCTPIPIPPPPPPPPAQPELDLSEKTDWWFLRTSDADQIRAKTREGYRIFRLDAVRGTSPVEFTALFVKNTGAYARDWGSGLPFTTESTFEGANELANHPDLRIIDVSCYVNAAGEERYALVLVANTGAHRRNKRILLRQGSLTDIRFQASETGYRITDLDFEPTLGFYSAVLVEEPTLGQVILEGTTTEILHAIRVLHKGWRPVSLEPARFPGTFFAVLEKRPSGKTNLHQWWTTDLRFHGAPPPYGDGVMDHASLDQVDNVGVLWRRLAGRYTEYKSYPVDNPDGTTSDKYLTIATENGNYEMEPKAVKDADGTLMENAATREIDTAMQNAMKQFGVPGGSIAVTKGGKLVYARGYGSAQLSFGLDATRTQPEGDARNVDPGFMFRLASVSKPITGLGILRMMEKPELSSITVNTKPFGEIWPVPAGITVDAALSNITLKNLLQHRVFWANDVEPSLGGLANNDARIDFIQRYRTQTGSSAVGVRTGPKVRDGCAPAAKACYDNLNYVILGLVIEKLTGSYDAFIQTEFLSTIGLERIAIRPPREDSFMPRVCRPEQQPGCFDNPFPEAASYDNVTHGRRDWDPVRKVYTFRGPFTSDGGGSTDYYNGAAGWSASPVDLLRLWSVVDGSVTIPGQDVFSSFHKIVSQADDPESVTSNHVLGPVYTVYSDWGTRVKGVRVLDHGGYFPATATTYFALRDEGPSNRKPDGRYVPDDSDTKFAVLFNNGGAVEGESAAHPKDILGTVAGGGAANVLWDIHDILNRYQGALPEGDLWPVYFTGVPPQPGLDCAGIGPWQPTPYAPGHEVQQGGQVYRCRPYPHSGWCGQVGYRPGVDQAWEHAWESTGTCGTGTIHPPAASCFTLPDWTVQAYEGGYRVQSQGAMYECKGWPQSGWCGQAGYEPGVTLYWQDAWLPLGSCFSDVPQTLEYRNLDKELPFVPTGN